jgi:hypothetical protein
MTRNELKNQSELLEQIIQATEDNSRKLRKSGYTVQQVEAVQEQILLTLNKLHL